MGKYCCFFDPKYGTEEKELTELCPDCGRPYGFPVENYPENITNGAVEYSIIKSLGRGFYGVTYLCKAKKRFKTENTLLKIIPKGLYDFFGKDFEKECSKHSEVAEGTEHIVGIQDAFEAPVQFGNEILDCYIAELEYINGVILDEYIKTDENITPSNFAQIAIDLFRLWNELIAKREYHNDLHAGNLIVENLDLTIQRTEAINDRIRVVAIDLNSVTGESLSNAETGRVGDQQYISQHLKNLTTLLKEKYTNFDEEADADFRLIETLEKISNIILPKASAVDIPDINELIKMIKAEFNDNLSYSPWKKEFTLNRLNEGINAQTIHSCHMPLLLVDPEESWLNKISISGPQIITGMRGCGKTMLLNSLDIHARLFGQGNKETSEEKIKRIEDDQYIGIVTSCRNLVNYKNETYSKMIDRLVWLYAIQAIRASRHLHDVDNRYVTKDFHRNISEAICILFGIEIPVEKQYSGHTLEKYLCLQTGIVFDESSKLSLKVKPIEAFEILANVIVNISTIWKNKPVFFLLDDASTRYLDQHITSDLLSKLLFISPTCAFKITTELQTFAFNINSPGNIERAQENRDYQIFDLGADVYGKTKNTRSGKEFIEEILLKRAQYYQSHPKDKPSEVLGDCSLTSIAEQIVSTRETSADRKVIYHGISALTALCVGDIGDVIFLYDSILMNSGKTYPVSAKKQTECYQQLCSRRIYNLERKNSKLRDYAKSFAEASYKLLIESKKDIKMERTKRDRLREYNSLYVKVTAGDTTVQSQQLRELIDAGIFVFADGTGTPRTKSADTDPILQFKLAYRKLFGLCNSIGLSNSDRFELSGSQLEEWLRNPTKEILMKNSLEITEQEASDEILTEEDKTQSIKTSSLERQLSLFDDVMLNDGKKSVMVRQDKQYLENRIFIDTIEISSEGNLFDVGIFALGFEERSLESVKKVLSCCHFKRIILIEYEEEGKTIEIEKLVKSHFDSVTKIKYYDNNRFDELLIESESFLLDITGMNKPIIFNGIRHGLKNNKTFVIAYTSAQHYYPLESDIAERLDKLDTENELDSFNQLMGDLLTGESSPYEIIPLINQKYDSMSRPYALIGFMSPKNQRIFTLLDNREYDQVQLLVPNGDTNRNRLTQTAAKIAHANYSNIILDHLDINNPEILLKSLLQIYDNLFIDESMNIDIALTGSKIQTMISAAFSSVCKVSQCWYVKPSKFDVEHFTKGVGETQFYFIHK